MLERIKQQFILLISKNIINSAQICQTTEVIIVTIITIIIISYLYKSEHKISKPVLKR